jgi:hypothetical protein
MAMNRCDLSAQTLSSLRPTTIVVVPNAVAGDAIARRVMGRSAVISNLKKTALDDASEAERLSITRVHRASFVMWMATSLRFAPHAPLTCARCGAT